MEDDFASQNLLDFFLTGEQKVALSPEENSIAGGNSENKNDFCAATKPHKRTIKTKVDSDPNGISYGQWTIQEHEIFLSMLKKYRNRWKKIQKFIKTRNCSQIRSHAQKYFKILRERELKKLRKSQSIQTQTFLIQKEYRNYGSIFCSVINIRKKQSHKRKKLEMTQIHPSNECEFGLFPLEFNSEMPWEEDVDIVLNQQFENTTNEPIKDEFMDSFELNTQIKFFSIEEPIQEQKSVLNFSDEECSKFLEID